MCVPMDCACIYWSCKTRIISSVSPGMATWTFSNRPSPVPEKKGLW
ncbi:hypothetical protein [uncultured Desulfobacter sp.]